MTIIDKLSKKELLKFFVVFLIALFVLGYGPLESLGFSTLVFIIGSVLEIVANKWKSMNKRSTRT